MRLPTRFVLLGLALLLAALLKALINQLLPNSLPLLGHQLMLLHHPLKLVRIVTVPTVPLPGVTAIITVCPRGEVVQLVLVLALLRPELFPEFVPRPVSSLGFTV
jgi:hypothetical protein